jgi:hypothetical protein
MLRMTILDPVALLHHLGGMLDPLGPRHVGDVDQAVDPRLDFTKAPKLVRFRPAADPRADRY